MPTEGSELSAAIFRGYLKHTEYQKIVRDKTERTTPPGFDHIFETERKFP